MEANCCDTQTFHTDLRDSTYAEYLKRIKNSHFSHYYYSKGAISPNQSASWPLAQTTATMVVYPAIAFKARQNPLLLRLAADITVNCVVTPEAPKMLQTPLSLVMLLASYGCPGRSHPPPTTPTYLQQATLPNNNWLICRRYDWKNAAINPIHAGCRCSKNQLLLFQQPPTRTHLTLCTESSLQTRCNRFILCDFKHQRVHNSTSAVLLRIKHCTPKTS